MALTDKLTSIANAIREKGGTTEKLTLDAMPTAIAALSTGGGEMEIPVLTGDMKWRFANGGWDWFIEKYGNKITTENISNMEQVFYFSKVKEIPFTINTNAAEIGWEGAFTGCSELKYVAKIPKIKANKMGSMFSYCYKLRQLPEVDDIQYKITSSYSLSAIFQRCYSLRKIPEIYINKMLYSEGWSQTSYLWYYNMCCECYALDEINGIRVATAKEVSSNAFYNTFQKCYHLKSITFETNSDGTPIQARWKKQTIDLSQYAGWAGNNYADTDITTRYNSGITADKEVGTGKGSYADLKDDPDWWSREFGFSRFGHDAAVELINSLPDTSAYLATQTGTGNNNTIKFYTNAGMYIDGGVSQLTEEEVAVAAAKGWTISYTTA
jgi:hypothetical protein